MLSYDYHGMINAGRIMKEIKLVNKFLWFSFTFENRGDKKRGRVFGILVNEKLF